MKTRQLFFAGVIAFGATGILGQALPSMFPSKPPRLISGTPQNEVRIFQISAKAYQVTLSHDDIFDGPEWRPSLPLPLDFDKVEKIAREELRKLVADESRWEVTNLGLRRLPQTLWPEWYYVVELQQKWDGVAATRGFFPEIISLSGKPGKVELRSIPQ